MSTARVFIRLSFLLLATLVVFNSCSDKGTGSGGNNPPPTSTRYRLTDFAGTWDYHILNSGSTDAGNFWAYGTWEIDTIGNVTALPQTASNGDNEPNCDGCVLLIDSVTGVVTIQQIEDFHAVMGKSKNIMVGAATGDGGNHALLVLSKRGQVTFGVPDLAGTWDFHGLCAGYPPAWSGWAYGKGHITGGGELIFDSIIRSNQDEAVPLPSTVTITPAGVVDIGHGIMNSDKNLIVHTMSDGGGGYSLGAFTKRISSFDLADLAGTWMVHGLVSGNTPDSGDWIGWNRFTLAIGSNGGMTITSFRDSDGDTTVPQGSFYATVTPPGIMTFGYFHGAIAEGSELFVGVEPADGGGYELVIGLKR